MKTAAIDDLEMAILQLSKTCPCSPICGNCLGGLELVRRLRELVPLLEEMRQNCADRDEDGGFREEFDRAIALAKGGEERPRRCGGCPSLAGTPCVQRCHADDDDYCNWDQCPQNRDGEPHKSGRSCPLYDWTDRTT